MLSEAVLDTALVRVAPVSGKEALGKWRAPIGNIVWTQCQVRRC